MAVDLGAYIEEGEGSEIESPQEAVRGCRALDASGEAEEAYVPLHQR